MATIPEADVEQAALDRVSGLGWRVARGRQPASLGSGRLLRLAEVIE